MSDSKMKTPQLDFEQFLNAFPALIGYWNSELVNLYANQGYSDYFGKSPKEILGLKIWDLLGPELYQKNKTYVDGVLQGVRQTFEREIPLDGGGTRSTISNYVPDIKDGVVRGFFVFLTDITETKNREITLQIQQQKIDAIYQASPDAIMLLDETGFFDCNARTLSLFQVKSKLDFCRLHPSQLSPPLQENGLPSLEEANLHIQRAYVEGIHTFEWIHRTANGSDFYAEVVLSSFELGGKKVLQASVRDISQRKTQEKKIIEQQQSLVAASKMSLLGEMAGGIAHEINNPLAIIHGKAALLKRKLDTGQVDVEAFKAELTKIEDTADRIAKIVRGLKSFSRNSEKDPMVATRLPQIVEDTLELCKERFKNHGIALKVGPIPEELLECRSSQVAQVLMNLLGNAHDAIESKSEKWVEIEFKSEAKHFVISVTDCGQGIPKEVQEKMMRPFFTTKEVGKGTGLGLSISKGIVEDHQGTLEYDSNCPNTRFMLRLPKVQESSIDVKKRAA